MIVARITTTRSGAFRQIAIAATATPSTRSSTRERLTVPEGLHRDERAEKGGSEELDHAREPLGERTAAEQHRADRLDRDRAGAHQPDDEPRLAHRLNPSRHAALAAMIGTPAGANGVSASAIVAPSNAAAT